jgi:hypothetical protein
LLQPRAIRRVAAARVKAGRVPSDADIRQKLLEICEGERQSIEDAFASALIQVNRKLDVITANKSARAHVEKLWRSEDARLAVASGKTLLSELSKWTQGDPGVTFGPPAIARQMRVSEMPRELIEVIRSIEEGSTFPTLEDRQAWVA